MEEENKKKSAEERAKKAMEEVKTKANLMYWLNQVALFRQEMCMINYDIKELRASFEREYLNFMRKGTPAALDFTLMKINPDKNSNKEARAMRVMRKLVKDMYELSDVIEAWVNDDTVLNGEVCQ